jgi:hypothetical protein
VGVRPVAPRGRGRRAFDFLLKTAGYCIRLQRHSILTPVGTVVESHLGGVLLSRTVRPNGRWRSPPTIKPAPLPPKRQREENRCRGPLSGWSCTRPLVAIRRLRSPRGKGANRGHARQSQKQDPITEPNIVRLRCAAPRPFRRANAPRYWPLIVRA